MSTFVKFSQGGERKGNLWGRMKKVIADWINELNIELRARTGTCVIGQGDIFFKLLMAFIEDRGKFFILFLFWNNDS